MPSYLESRNRPDTTLVPNGDIVFGGSGANRTVTITPAANQSGSATITITVSDGSLTASDTFVLTVAAAPEVTVKGNSQNISDGDSSPSTTDGTNFGSASLGGSTVSRTFTVFNDGDATLTLSNLSVPTGYTITEGLSSSIAAGSSDMFTVRLDTTTTGTKSGQISFDNNDSDENPFNFSISGTVAAAGPIVVSNTADSGAGSLRQAILDANATAGRDIIQFSIASGARTISLASSLPLITDSVVIDATTQPGFVGRPLIELDGTNAGNSDGLKITAGNSVVRGLVIRGFEQSGIVLADGDNNVVEGNFIGTNALGTIAHGNDFGVKIEAGSAGNRIGTDGNGVNDAAEMNLLSGNRADGVLIKEVGSDNNSVTGNLIGTDLAGIASLSNNYGVRIESGSKGNRVGTNGDGAGDVAERNVISGNRLAGILIIDVGTSGNLVAGNYIGTTANGTADLGNAQDGVVVDNSAGNVIGGTLSAARNLVSGNDSFGIVVQGAASTNNVIAGNYVGVTASGLAALGNGASGVWVRQAAHDNRIGTNGDGANDVGERNLISGNGFDGIAIEGVGTNGNIVAGNYIGTDIAGTVALGGNHFAVKIADGAKSNRIGTNGDGVADASERNILSGNLWDGVFIADMGTDGNVVAGNYIGVDVNGASSLVTEVLHSCVSRSISFSGQLATTRYCVASRW